MFIIDLATIVAVSSIVALYLSQILLNTSFGYCPTLGKVAQGKAVSFQGVKAQPKQESKFQSNLEGLLDAVAELGKSVMPDDASVAHLAVVEKRRTNNGTFFYIFRNKMTGKKFVSFVPTALHNLYGDIEACHWAFEKFPEEVAQSYLTPAKEEFVVLSNSLA